MLGYVPVSAAVKAVSKKIRDATEKNSLQISFPQEEFVFLRQLLESVRITEANLKQNKGAAEISVQTTVHVRPKNIAESLRKFISDWLRTLAIPMSWRGYLKHELLPLIVEKKIHKNNWRKWMQSIQPTLESRYPQKSEEISTTIQKYLIKSPLEDFLKEYAYKWLQHLDNNPPAACSWFPACAVEVAHAAFCLNGKLATLKKFVCKREETLRRLNIIPIVITDDGEVSSPPSPKRKRTTTVPFLPSKPEPSVPKASVDTNFDITNKFNSTLPPPVPPPRLSPASFDYFEGTSDLGIYTDITNKFNSTSPLPLSPLSHVSYGSLDLGDIEDICERIPCSPTSPLHSA